MKDFATVQIPSRIMSFPPLCSGCLGSATRKFKPEKKFYGKEWTTTWSIEIPICEACYKKATWFRKPIFIGIPATIFMILAGLIFIPSMQQTIRFDFLIASFFAVAIGTAIVGGSLAYGLAYLLTQRSWPVRLDEVSRYGAVKLSFANEKYAKMFSEANPKAYLEKIPE